jgi:hypothetical protein
MTCGSTPTGSTQAQFLKGGITNHFLPGTDRQPVTSERGPEAKFDSYAWCSTRFVCWTMMCGTSWAC